MTLYANANFNGQLTSANNLKGINVIPVSLVNTTAQTWTHNFGATPLAILNFVNNNTNGGAQSQSTTLGGIAGIAVTSNNNAITLTPVSTQTFLCVIIWSLPNGSQNGTPLVNFV